MAGMMLSLGACQRHNTAAAADRQAANGATQSAPIASPIESNEDASTPALRSPPGIEDAATFVPLRSDAVKDAIHRALRTGQSQRWQDGALSGYAVPSVATDIHGCRAVRYTIDQLHDAPLKSINACEG